MNADEFIISPESQVLVTGANGFLGSHVVGMLLKRGQLNIRCMVRPSGDARELRQLISQAPVHTRIQTLQGDLLSPKDCLAASQGVEVIYHLAAGTGTKSHAEAFLNSVVTTRNLLDSARQNGILRRLVNLSSFSVYSNRKRGPGGILDESSAIEDHPESRAEAYCYAKVKQDEMVIDYAERHSIPYVIVRPGVIYGPGKSTITGRVGIDTFGVFLHFGGGSPIPFTYVDNCADAVVLAGLKAGIDGQVFNVVDDELPSSRQFLRSYKKNVRSFRSIYVPKLGSYLFCLLWEKYSNWSHGQLPRSFSRDEWRAYWRPTKYNNQALKEKLGWSPTTSTGEGLNRYFVACRESAKHA